MCTADFRSANDFRKNRRVTEVGPRDSGSRSWVENRVTLLVGFLNLDFMLAKPEVTLDYFYRHFFTADLCRVVYTFPSLWILVPYRIALSSSCYRIVSILLGHYIRSLHLNVYVYLLWRRY